MENILLFPCVAVRTKIFLFLSDPEELVSFFLSDHRCKLKVIKLKYNNNDPILLTHTYMEKLILSNYYFQKRIFSIIKCKYLNQSPIKWT